MKSFKTEFFPDGFDVKGNNLGPCAMVLHFHKPNTKRWNKLTREEKSQACALIAQFQSRLEQTKKELFPDED